MRAGTLKREAPDGGSVHRGRILIGLVIAFAALVLAPVIEDGLDQFAILAVALLVVAGLAIVWRALAEPLE